MKKFERYWEYRFNIEKFVRDYTENKRILEDKKSELAELTEVRRPNYESPPRTPGRGDSVPASVQTAEKVRAEIEYYRDMTDTYKKAFNRLSDEEKMVIR